VDEACNIKYIMAKGITKNLEKKIQVAAKTISKNLVNGTRP